MQTMTSRWGMVTWRLGIDPQALNFPPVTRPLTRTRYSRHRVRRLLMKWTRRLSPPRPTLRFGGGLLWPESFPSSLRRRLAAWGWCGSRRWNVKVGIRYNKVAKRLEVRMCMCRCRLVVWYGMSFYALCCEGDKRCRFVWWRRTSTRHAAFSGRIRTLCPLVE